MIFFLVGIVIVWLLYRYLSPPKNLPPGPIGLPYFGYAIRYADYTQHFMELKERYGPIFSYNAGPRYVVILNDFDSFNDAIIRQGDKFINRPSSLLYDELFHNQGLLLNNGPLWKEQRRFAMSTLRDFGFGKPILENSVRDEVDTMLSEFKRLEGVPTDPKLLLNKVVANVICKIAFGHRFDYDDPTFSEGLNSVISQVADNQIMRDITFRSWMFYVPYVRANLKKYGKLESAEKKFLKNIIQNHRNHFNVEDEPTDYIYAFLKAEAKGIGQYFYEDQLVEAVRTLFAAGTETTATTLRWALLFLSRRQDIQQKVADEIMTQVGSNVHPQWSDRSKLPWVEATILEVQRLSHTVPIVGREAAEDAVVLGYNIPKGTTTFGHTKAIHLDPKYFPQPEEFRPERWLDEENRVKRIDQFVPFGAGKRICLGESLARMEVFLFFSALFQQFHFTLAPQHKDEGVIEAITMQPRNVVVIATSRHT